MLLFKTDYTRIKRKKREKIYDVSKSFVHLDENEHQDHQEQQPTQKHAILDLIVLKTISSLIYMQRFTGRIRMYPKLYETMYEPGATEPF